MFSVSVAPAVPLHSFRRPRAFPPPLPHLSLWFLHRPRCRSLLPCSLSCGSDWSVRWSTVDTDWSTEQLGRAALAEFHAVLLGGTIYRSAAGLHAGWQPRRHHVPGWDADCSMALTDQIDAILLHQMIWFVSTHLPRRLFALIIWKRNPASGQELVSCGQKKTKR